MCAGWPRPGSRGAHPPGLAQVVTGADFPSGAPFREEAVSSNREFLGAGLWAPVLEYLKASPVVLALRSPVGRGLCEGPPSAPGVIQSRSEGAAFPAEEGPVCGFLVGVSPTPRQWHVWF